MPAIDWTPELEAGVLDAIEGGDTLRKAATAFNISAAAILRHVTDSEAFAKQYARVIDVRTDADCDALADQLLETPQETQYGVDSGWVAWKRVQIDTMKWLLSKRKPKVYGDKLAHTGPEGDGPVIIRVVSDI